MSFIIIEPWDFSQPLHGNGSLTVLDSLVRHAGDRLRIVGSTSGDTPIGNWTRIRLHNHDIPFLPVARAQHIARPWMGSSNIQFAIALRRHLGLVRQCFERAVFTRTYAIHWALLSSRDRWETCFFFPGLANPFAVGKRRILGRFVAPLYEWLQLRTTARASVAFAPASPEIIGAYNDRLREIHSRVRVQLLPTAVDIDQFRPTDLQAARQELDLPARTAVFVFVGRLAAVKGLPFLFEALRQVRSRIGDALLLVIGEGEQRAELEQLLVAKGWQDMVRLLGVRPPEFVAKAINCADVCVCGSLAEGISNATLEQMACGKPVVSTRVSGIDLLVKDGVNGFIVENRDPAQFADRMIRAMNLPSAALESRRIIEERFSERARWQTLEAAWAPMRVPRQS